MIDRALVSLLAGCAVFGAVIIVELGPTEDTEPTVAPAPARPQPGPPARAQAPAIEEQVATAIARPLFSATRRPVEKASAAGADEPELPDVRLTGIILEPDRHLAIFAVAGAKPLVRAEGESLKEWRLDSISPSEVSLSGPGGLRTLEPKTDPNLVRPAPPALPAAAPAQPARPAQPGAAAQPAAPVARPPALVPQPAPVATAPPRPAANRAPNPFPIPLRPSNAPRAPQ